MIIDKLISIKVCRANIRFYKEKYNCKVDDVIEVKIDDIPFGVILPVLVSCDVCFSEKSLSYKKYIQNINRGGYYSCSSKCSNSKRKETYFNKTGFEHQLQNPLVREKIKNTCLIKYGVDNPNKNDLVKEKTNKTCYSKYGSKNYVNSKKFKEDMIDKYGVDNPMLSVEVNDKRIKSSFYIDEYQTLKYQGKYELDFLFYCRDNNIGISKPGFTIKYIENEKLRKYIPDFFIQSLNLVIEIKSTYYFNLHRDKNLLKKEYTISSGYNYIIIMDKNYIEFSRIINERYDF